MARRSPTPRHTRRTTHGAQISLVDLEVAAFVADLRSLRCRTKRKCRCGYGALYVNDVSASRCCRERERSRRQATHETEVARVTPLELLRELRQRVARFCSFRTSHLLSIARIRNRRQDADDGDRDHELDQCESDLS